MAILAGSMVIVILYIVFLYNIHFIQFYTSIIYQICYHPSSSQQGSLCFLEVMELLISRGKGLDWLAHVWLQYKSDLIEFCLVQTQSAVSHKYEWLRRPELQ